MSVKCGSREERKDERRDKMRREGRELELEEINVYILGSEIDAIMVDILSTQRQ